MPHPEEFRNDHDAIITLITEFREYKKQDSLDKQQIRADIKDLRENTQHRVDLMEMEMKKKLDQDDFIKYKDGMTKILFGDDGKGGIREDVNYLREYKGTIVVTFATFGAIGSTLAFLLINHLLGK